MDGDTNAPSSANGGDAPLPTPTPPATAREAAILESIKEKEYEAGDRGKLTALRDIQLVFDELTDAKHMAQYDLLTQYKSLKAEESFSQQDQELKGQSQTPRKKYENLTLTSRFVPPIMPVEKPPPATVSEPNLGKKLQQREHTASLPTLIGHQDVKQQERKSRSRVPSSFYDTDAIADSSAIEITTDDQTSKASEMIQESISALKVVQKDLDMMTTRPSAPILTPRTGESKATFEEASETAYEETTDHDFEDSWRGDLNKLTRTKSAATGRSTVQSEEDTLQLKYKPPIWPHQKFLFQILSQRPTLTCLVLDRSELQFMRDLGSFLPSLRTLSVSHCGLSSLDGVGAFPNLRTLIASHNNLSHAAQCSYLNFLSCLDLTDNPIEEVGHFGFLRICTKLRHLKLLSTPASRLPDFHYRMRRLLPQVKELFPAEQVTRSNPPKKQAPSNDNKIQDPMKETIRKTLDSTYKKLLTEGKPLLKGIEHIRHLVTPRTDTSTTMPTTASFPTTAASFPTTAASEITTESSFDARMLMKSKYLRADTGGFGDISNISSGQSSDAEETEEPWTELLKPRPRSSKTMSKGEGEKTESSPFDLTEDGDKTSTPFEPDSTSSDEFFECEEEE